MSKIALVPEPYKLLLELLSNAIRAQKPEINIPQSLNWSLLHQTAMHHQVSALLYPTIKKLPTDQQPDQKLMKEWEHQSTIAGIVQYYHIERTEQVIKEFNNSGIPIMIMKGLVLRDLYPYPELRTMSDADLMIKKEDLKKAKKLLINMGYKDEKYPCPIHCGFKHHQYPRVELHTSLIDPDFSFTSKKLENKLWLNPAPYKINQTHCQRFNTEIDFIFLFLHLAKHYVKSDLNLRQLCDLVLFIETHNTQMNWESTLQMSREANIEKFVVTMLELFQKFFSLKLSSNIESLYPNDPNLLQSLLQDIFWLGDYAKCWEIRRMAGEQLKRSQKSNQAKEKKRIRYILSVIFPAIQNLDYRFTYAQKLPLLYPFALIHRFFWALSFKGLSVGNKYQLLIDASAFSKKRSTLLNELKLLK